MSNSTHRVEVVPIQLESHPNADSLSVVRIFDYYTACVRTADWVGKNIGAYIPPDSIVPDTPEYAWLNGSLRIRARKFRGVQSQGLLVYAPEGSKIGDDVAEILGVRHYDPVIDFNMGDAEADPPIPGEHYDIDSWFRYGKLIPDGTDIEITEKIHGTNFRITFQEDRLRVGSRNQYRKKSDSCLYWQAVKYNPWIEEIAIAHPGKVFYGEVFGWVQNLRYGAARNTPHMLKMFDVFDHGRYLNADDRYKLLDESQKVPVLYRGPSSEEIIMKYISGPSTIPGANHYREGIVIKPTTELYDVRIGRLVLKAVSPEYLEKN